MKRTRNLRVPAQRDLQGVAGGESPASRTVSPQIRALRLLLAGVVAAGLTAVSGAVPAAAASTETSSSVSLESSDAYPSVDELVTLSATVAVTTPAQLTGTVTF